MEDLSPAFMKEGQVVGEFRATFLLLLFSLTPAAEDSQYSGVPYFSVTCPEPHRGEKLNSLSPMQHSQVKYFLICSVQYLFNYYKHSRKI